MRCWFGALAALAVLTGPSRVNAEPLRRGALSLEWTAPGGCPNRVEVVERIEALLGARIDDLRPEPIAANGDVRPLGPGRFELTLETHQSEQRFVRSMQAPSCAELSEAGALVLALAIDPTLAERQARAAEGGPGTSALPAETPAAPDAKPAPAEPKPEPKKPEPAAPVRTLDAPDPQDERAAPAPESPPLSISGAARLEAVVDLGSVASVSGGVRASGAAEISAYRLGLAFLWLPPRRSYVEGSTTQGGDVDLVAGQLFGCQLPLRGALELEACGAVELGSIHGAGFGTDTRAEGSAFWFGFGATFTGRLWATKGLGFVVGAGISVIPQGIEFTLENVGAVHATSPIVGRGTLGVETEF